MFVTILLSIFAVSFCYALIKFAYAPEKDDPFQENEASTPAESEETLKKKKKRLELQSKYSRENTTAILNELFPNSRYEDWKVEGPFNEHQFTVRVQCNGKYYYGTSTSRKLARACASARAIAAFEEGL